MTVVACSDGPNGLADEYPTQGDLPTFPNIGGVPAIAGHGSDKVRESRRPRREKVADI